MIPIIWHSGKGKAMQTVKRLVVVRSCGWEEGRIGRKTIFLAQLNTLYDNLTVNTCRYKFPKLIK